jgi:hypothetical protein
MTICISEFIHEWMGWCPNAPILRTAPAVLIVPPEPMHPAEPGSSGSPGNSGRVRCGIRIATGSLRALFRERRLLWFSILAGLVTLFLIAVEEWTVVHIQSSPPFLIDIPGGGAILTYPFLDTRLFLIEMICLSCITILLAGLVLYRAGNLIHKSLTIREVFAGVSAHAGPLGALSTAMALSGIFLYEIISQSQFFGKVINTIDMAVFYLPYAYYVPNVLSAAIYFSVKIMFVNMILFLAALYVVPVIVLGKKGLVIALADSFGLMRRTWREMLGCVLVFGAIVLLVAAVALMIGQSPLLLSHDYDFFLQVSRGQVLMTGVCYGFIIACWVMMAGGFTAAGIAITDLYSCGTETKVQRNADTGVADIAEPAS